MSSIECQIFILNVNKQKDDDGSKSVGTGYCLF